jgi:hypothetical protein
VRLNAMDEGVHFCTAYLDGQKAPHCFEADEGEGWALCAVTDADGKILADPDGYDGVKVEIRTGTVELRFDPPEWREWVAARQARERQ